MKRLKSNRRVVQNTYKTKPRIVKIESTCVQGLKLTNGQIEKFPTPNRGIARENRENNVISNCVNKFPTSDEGIVRTFPLTNCTASCDKMMDIGEVPVASIENKHCAKKSEESDDVSSNESLEINVGVEIIEADFHLGLLQ